MSDIERSIAGGLRRLGLELRHLEALSAVAREGSFKRAAGRLGYSQPALSQQIAALERIVGTKLVERSHSGPISLTVAGRVLLRHAEAVVAQLHAAQADLGRLQHDAPIRVGVFESVGNFVIPSLLREFRNREPDVRVELAERAAPDELAQLVADGAADAAFVVLPIENEQLATTTVLADPYVLIGAAGSEYSAAVVRPGDLKQLPLVALDHAKAYPVDFPEGRALEAGAVVRAADNQTLLGLVRAGIGVALVPLLMVDPDDATLVPVRHTLDIPRREVALVWNRERLVTRALQTLIDLTVEVCAEIQTSLEEAWERRERNLSPAA